MALSLLGSIVLASPEVGMAVNLVAFESRIRDLVPDLERVYTDLHAHPELSMQETRTAGIAAHGLVDLGFDVTPGIGSTGVVGLLRSGEGPTVMLRADMDALPVREATGLPYASAETATDAAGKIAPVMHACGRPRRRDHLGGRQPPDPAVRPRRARVDAAANHNPRFAPVLHPTLEAGVSALVAASLAWLPS